MKKNEIASQYLLNKKSQIKSFSVEIPFAIFNYNCQILLTYLTTNLLMPFRSKYKHQS